MSLNNLPRSGHQCPHDPKETHPAVGMYHCPECGEMVIANMEHPDYSNTVEISQ